MGNRTIHLGTLLLEIKRRARSVELDRQSGARAREEVLRFVADHPDTPEAKVLARIIAAIDSGVGEFSESDVYALSTRSLALVAAMVDTAMEGL